MFQNTGLFSAPLRVDRGDCANRGRSLLADSMTYHMALVMFGTAFLTIRRLGTGMIEFLKLCETEWDVRG